MKILNGNHRTEPGIDPATTANGPHLSALAGLPQENVGRVDARRNDDRDHSTCPDYESHPGERGRSWTGCTNGHRLIAREYGELGREEAFDFTLHQYDRAVQLVCHEDTALLAKLKAMFEIVVVLTTILFSVASFLVAHGMAGIVAPLMVSISSASFFVSLGYHTLISEGLACLVAHKAKITAIEEKFGLPPLLTRKPNRWLVRYGPIVFIWLSIAGIALGLILLTMPSSTSFLENLARKN